MIWWGKENGKVRRSNCSRLLNHLPFSFLFPSPNPWSKHNLKSFTMGIEIIGTYLARGTFNIENLFMISLVDGFNSFFSHQLVFNWDSPIQVYNLHRSPYFWDKPHEFEPERFLAQKKSEGIEGWAGFDPSRSPGALYPNEV